MVLNRTKTIERSRVGRTYVALCREHGRKAVVSVLDDALHTSKFLAQCLHQISGFLRAAIKAAIFPF